MPRPVFIGSRCSSAEQRDRGAKSGLSVAGRACMGSQWCQTHAVGSRYSRDEGLGGCTPAGTRKSLTAIVGPHTPSAGDLSPTIPGLICGPFCGSRMAMDNLNLFFLSSVSPVTRRPEPWRRVADFPRPVLRPTGQFNQIKIPQSHIGCGF